MIFVTGSIVAKPEHVDEVQRLSLEHVARSRTEPGCLLHSVHRDVENAERFVFIEHWADKQALLAHFGAAASNDFMRAASAMAVGDPGIEIYEAERAVL